jgi:hypothetical protein
MVRYGACRAAATLGKKRVVMSHGANSANRLFDERTSKEKWEGEVRILKWGFAGGAWTGREQASRVWPSTGPRRAWSEKEKVRRTRQIELRCKSALARRFPADSFREERAF